MIWTYYRQNHPSGIWTLFRSMPGRFDEIYRRGDGWYKTETLFDRQHKGDVTDGDIVPEAEAEALIAFIPTETTHAGSA